MRRVAMPGSNLLFSILGGGTQEGQFDGFMQETEEGFFLRFFATDPDAFVTAERAEFKHLSAAPSQVMHAFVAHDFPAVGALVSSFGVAVAGTNQGTIS